MELIVFIKILADMSLYFAFASFFGSLFGLKTIMLIPALILTVSAFLCWLLRNEKTCIRLLPLALIALCLFFASNLVQYAVLFIGAAYTIYISVKQLFACQKGEAIGLLRFGLLLGVILVIIAAAFIKTNAAVNGTLIFLLIFTIASILQIRMLRFEIFVLSSKRLKFLNIALIAIICLLCVIFSSSFFIDSIVAAFQVLAKYVISPFFVKLAELLGLLVRAIASLMSGIDVKENSMDNFGKDLSAEDLDLTATNNEQWGSAKYIVIAITVFIIAIIVLAAVLIFRKMILGRYKDIEEKNVNSTRFETKRVHKHRGNVSGERLQIRDTYRRFLLLCRKHNIEFEPSHTSLDIAKASSQDFGAQSHELRKLYINARYNEQGAIDSAQVKHAKTLYNEMKSGKTNRNSN